MWRFLAENSPFIDQNIYNFLADESHNKDSYAFTLSQVQNTLYTKEKQYYLNKEFPDNNFIEFKRSYKTCAILIRDRLNALSIVN